MELGQQWAQYEPPLPELLGVLAEVRQYEVGDQGRCWRRRRQEEVIIGSVDADSHVSGSSYNAHGCGRPE